MSKWQKSDLGKRVFEGNYGLLGCDAVILNPGFGGIRFI
jgi:hypothetical protein